MEQELIESVKKDAEGKQKNPTDNKEELRRKREERRKRMNQQTDL